MQAALVHCTKDGNTKKIPIAHERTLMGRLDDCQVRIPSGKISRHHCELLFDNGSFTLKDLGSSNGTFVNKEQIESRAVGAGDLISIGGLVFVLVIDGSPSEIDGASFYAQGVPERKAKEGDAPEGAPKSEALVSKHAPTTSGDDSSMMDFNFEFDLDDEDEDDQPPL